MSKSAKEPRSTENDPDLKLWAGRQIQQGMLAYLFLVVLLLVALSRQEALMRLVASTWAGYCEFLTGIDYATIVAVFSGVYVVALAAATLGLADYVRRALLMPEAEGPNPQYSRKERAILKGFLGMTIAIFLVLASLLGVLGQVPRESPGGVPLQLLHLFVSLLLPIAIVMVVALVATEGAGPKGLSTIPAKAGGRGAFLRIVYQFAWAPLVGLAILGGFNGPVSALLLGYLGLMGALSPLISRYLKALEAWKRVKKT